MKKKPSPDDGERKGSALTAKRAQQCPPPYYSLPCALELCDEVIALSAPAYRLLHQVAALHDGFNNGHIALSHHTMRAFGWRSNSTRERALLELLNAGLLFQTKPGYGRTPRLFALPWLAVANPDRLTLAPDSVMAMPDAGEVRRAMKNAKEGAEESATWSLQTGAFISRLPGCDGHAEISRRDIFVSLLPGHKKNLASREKGRKGVDSSREKGRENRLRPVGRDENPPLCPVGRDANSRTVNRCVIGVDASRTDPTGPDLTGDEMTGGAS
jgi:hypothetical protein